MVFPCHQYQIFPSNQGFWSFYTDLVCYKFSISLLTQKVQLIGQKHILVFNQRLGTFQVICPNVRDMELPNPKEKKNVFSVIVGLLAH